VIKVYNKETSAYVGSITDEELRFLIDQLEEEDADDQDYYIDRDVIEMLTDNQASVSLLEFLSKALGTSDGVELRWERN